MLVPLTSNLYPTVFVDIISEYSLMAFRDVILAFVGIISEQPLSYLLVLFSNYSFTASRDMILAFVGVVSG